MAAEHDKSARPGPQTVADWTAHWDAKAGITDPVELNGYCVEGKPISLELYRAAVVEPWLELLQIEPHHHVLEIGCGSGMLLSALEARAARVVGTDVSPVQLQRYTGSAQTYLAPAHELPFSGEQFDRIVIASVSHYFPSLEYLAGVLRSAVQLLRPSGRLLVADMLIGTQPQDTPYLWYEPDALIEALEQIGVRFALQTQTPLKRTINRRYDLLLFKDGPEREVHSPPPVAAAPTVLAAPATAPASLLAAVSGTRDPYSELVSNRSFLEQLEEITETYMERGEFNDAAATAEVAAYTAQLHHPGVLASERLEAALARISREHLPAAAEPAAVAPASGKQRALIVVTETYDTGGHTRMVWRWVGRDPTRSYSVATTAQRGTMPDGIVRAVAQSGGQIFDLNADAPPLERAAALREYARDFDLIVLIDHMYDAIPSMAFAGMDARPPIVMFNHADHLFWLGRDIVDVLICIRAEGVPFAQRRGFPDARIATAPFPVFGPDGHGRDAHEPLDPRARETARKDVLGALGWPPDTVFMVTVGTAHKWEGPPGFRLLDWIEPVLEADPRVRLVAVGAYDGGQWAEARVRTGGRVMAVGKVPTGVGAMLAAADIFLDSLPIGGMAAPAEAAAHGLPVLSGGASQLECDLLGTDPAYGATLLVGVDAYRDLLVQLVNDPELRHQLGERARLTLVAADDGWEAAVERIFADAIRLGPVAPSEFAPLPPPDDRDLIVDWITTYRGKLSPISLTNEIRLRSLIAMVPALRPLYKSLEFRQFQQVARYGAAFGAPPPDPDTLRGVVRIMRTLSQFGLAERFVIALSPDDADVAVPILEEALAEGPDFELQVELNPNPRSLTPASALVVA